MMSARTRLKGIIHQELFLLPPGVKRSFKYALVEESLRQGFVQNRFPLGAAPVFHTKNARKWKLADGKKQYLVKDVGDHLVVIREKFPLLCRVCEFVLYDGKARWHQTKWRFQEWCRQAIWTWRKRWRDKPGALFINIGAGKWYARDWKVLEHQGKWYRFARWFIDFEHDLTSRRPFPFANATVRLFYSEHVFEHLKDPWCEHIFQEAHRCLERGGGFRMVVPDADLIYDRLVMKDAAFFKSWMDRDNASLAEAFRTLIGHSRAPLDEAEFDRKLSTLAKEAFLDWCTAGLEYDLNRTGEHINWFNFRKLAGMLQRAGFDVVQRSDAQQSRFAELRGPGFDTRAWYSLHVECIK